MPEENGTVQVEESDPTGTNCGDETVLVIDIGSCKRPEPESNIVSLVSVDETSEQECVPPAEVFPKPDIPKKLLELDTSDDSGIGDQSLHCTEQNIPQSSDSSSETYNHHEPAMKRKYVSDSEEENAPAAKRSTGPVSFTSRSPGYKRLFSRVYNLCEAAKKEMLDVSMLEPHVSRIMSWNPIDKILLRTIKNEIEMLLGDSFFSEGDEPTDIYETETESEDISSNSQPSEPSDDFPNVIPPSQEVENQSSSEVDDYAQKSEEDSDMENNSQSDLAFSIKGLNLVKREQEEEGAKQASDEVTASSQSEICAERDCTTIQQTRWKSGGFPLMGNVPSQRTTFSHNRTLPQEHSYNMCTQASQQPSHVGKSVPSISSFSKNFEGKSDGFFKGNVAPGYDATSSESTSLPTSPPQEPYGTQRKTTYRYLPASQEEKGQDPTLVGYCFLTNAEKSIKLELRFPPSVPNVSVTCVFIKSSYSFIICVILTFIITF